MLSVLWRRFLWEKKDKFEDKTYKDHPTKSNVRNIMRFLLALTITGFGVLIYFNLDYFQHKLQIHYYNTLNLAFVLFAIGGSSVIFDIVSGVLCFAAKNPERRNIAHAFLFANTLGRIIVMMSIVALGICICYMVNQLPQQHSGKTR